MESFIKPVKIVSGKELCEFIKEKQISFRRPFLGVRYWLPGETLEQDLVYTIGYGFLSIICKV